MTFNLDISTSKNDAHRSDYWRPRWTLRSVSKTNRGFSFHGKCGPIYVACNLYVPIARTHVDVVSLFRGAS